MRFYKTLNSNDVPCSVALRAVLFLWEKLKQTRKCVKKRITLKSADAGRPTKEHCIG